MSVGVQLKHWFFGSYWIIALVAGALISASTWTGLIEPSEFGAGLGLLLPFVYFVQKQKLEELLLFRDLFTGFNKRYDGMNECLSRMLAKPSGEALSLEEKEKLVDYFNLCGEEYLYYRRGYVFPEVWEAWANGMRVFYSSSRIRPFWDAELLANSYYGLDRVLQNGGNLSADCCGDEPHAD